MTIKKGILFLFLLIGITGLRAQNNAIEKYFSQYVDDENFTVVYISPRFFNLFNKLDLSGMEDEEAKALADIAKDMKELRVLTTDVNPRKYYDEAKRKINTREYEMLMTVRSKKAEKVEILAKEDGEGMITELLLLSGSDEDFVLISFVGKIEVEKVSTLINQDK